MKIKKYVLLFLILTIISYFIESRTNNYNKTGTEFLKNSKKFEKAHNIFLSTYGLNLDETIETPERDSIHRFDVMFTSLERLKLNDSRTKIIHCVEDYLKIINNNKKLKRFLCEYPFTQNGLHFNLFFYDENTEPKDTKYIHSCTLSENIIYYKIAYPNGTFACIHRETYEEALKIVEGEKSSN